MVSTRGGRGKVKTEAGTVRVKPEPKVKPEPRSSSRRASGDSEGGLLGAVTPPKKKAALKKKPAAKKKAPAKKAKPKKGPGVDLRTAKAKEKSSKVLGGLMENAVDPDSWRGKMAEKMKAKGRAAQDTVVVSHIPNAPDTVRYSIEVAKTGRSKCKKSGNVIPKGSLRWQCFSNGVGRGWIMLEHVTPVMLRNAIVTHGSLTEIHGFESMPAQSAVEVCNLFKEILKNGASKKGKKKGKKGKGKGKKKTKSKAAKGKTGGDSQILDEDTAEVEDDDEILVAATESLDEVLARKFKEASMAGNVMEIDCSDDEDEAPGLTQATGATAVASTTSVTEKVFEKVVPMQVDDDDDEEYDDDEEEDDEEEKAVDLPDRPPAENDLIFVRWEGDEKEYLCLVAGEEGNLEITSVDQEFEDSIEFDPSLDVWRFSVAATKAKPQKKPKGKAGANPAALKKKALASVKMGKNANALEGLTFVITGATEERPRDEFGIFVSALVESHGGAMRGAISGRTDYLVCGTYHYNPFLGSVGPIEGGSKYRAALAKGTKIIDEEMLMDIINGSGEV